MYGLIVERLDDGMLGMKHGVATFAIQFLECYYNAAICCYLVDIVFVVCDNTALRISGSSFRRKQEKTYITWYGLFV